MKSSTGTASLLLLALQSCVIITIASRSNKQLKDHQLKLPLHIRARRYCTDANCIKTCPLDYELDNEEQFCRYKRSTCPENYVRRGGSCVLAEVTCPTGSVRQGNRCVVKTVECPSGYTMEGSNCINSRYCPEDYHWENGFCYRQQRQQVCPNGYEHRNGMCTQLCVNCDAACSECDEETIPLKCPTGYTLHRGGKCLKIVQGRAEIVLRNVTYRVPVECDNDGIYHDGICLSKKYDRPRCDSGSFYAGKCVEVARCTRGVFSNDCECRSENNVPAVCRQGKPTSVGCVISDSQCRKPAQLIGSICVERKDTERAICTSGTPYNNMYCKSNGPRCASGSALEGGFCVRNVSYPVDCGPYQWYRGWCTSFATCDSGYQLQENGDCVREMTTQQEVCPQGTRYDGEHCVSNMQLCEPDHEFDERYGICVKCVSKEAVCNVAAGFHLRNGTCVKYDKLCPHGYIWNTNRCEKSSGDYATCNTGIVVDNYCVHSYLTCPDDQELIDGVCIRKEIPICPDNSVYDNGLCIGIKECPNGYTVEQDICVEETRTFLNNSLKPECRYGFHYEHGNCVRMIEIDSFVETRPIQCALGYILRNGKCVKEYRGLLVCPPKTIHMNQENKCFCKVDLVCPNGYERMGDECVFRSVGYSSPYLNFLNPCYGMQCNLQYCLSQCFSPPCPVQPCSYGAKQITSMYSSSNQLNSDLCGMGEACMTEENLETIVSLTCPPGYQKENNTCVAYYNRVCQTGYKLIDGVCLKFEESTVMCPLGFMLSNGTCLRIYCEKGYTREGNVCKKIEYHPPLPCPKNYIYIDGICLHKNDCHGGSIEGDYCIRRRFEHFRCPPKFTQLNDSCITLPTCSSSDLVLTEHACRSSEKMLVNCPPNTRRVRNMCVYDIHISYEKITLLPPTCNGRVIPHENWCAYIETPSCDNGYVLKNGRCVTCSSKKAQCPSDMVIINRKCIKYHKPCRDGWFLAQDGHCVSIDVRTANCAQGKLLLNRCMHHFPVCKTGYTLDGNRCIHNEIAIARCNEGILMDGICISLLQCTSPDYTLIDGMCVRNEYFEPTCNSKTARKWNKCISGHLKCPENHFQFDGKCYSRQIYPAECPNNAQCSDNFCPISLPNCISSFNFDGSICSKTISQTPKCPVGTLPVYNDRDYCQYSTEQADFYCPNEYNYKNGICQKRQYIEATCPKGYRKKMDTCVRRSCSSAALTVYCGTQGLSTHPLTPASHVPNIPHIPNVPLIPNVPHRLPPRPFNRTPPAVPTADEVCCRIYSPRICQYNEITGEWKCFHTESRRCGSFCLQPDQRLYLRTSEPFYSNNVLILVPYEHITDTRIEDMDDNDNYVDDSEPDCDGCTDGSYDCDAYCYVYDCQKDGNQCDFRDQRKFCSANPGPGCTATDGCYSRDYCVY